MTNLTAIREELKGIQGRRALLPAEDVVAWAGEHKNSELYKHFDWDDKSAAYAHRIWQARQLIKLVVEVPDINPTWVSLSIDRNKDGGGYRTAEQVKRTPALREILVRDVVTELVRIRERYSDLGKELAVVFAAIDKAKAIYIPEEEPIHVPVNGKANGKSATV